MIIDGKMIENYIFRLVAGNVYPRTKVIITEYGLMDAGNKYLGASLKQVIQATQKAIPDGASFLSGVNSWDGLFDSLKNEVRRMRETNYSDPLLTRNELIQREDWLNGVYSAALSLRNERRPPKHNLEWGKWDFCYFCWRIAPRGKRQTRCSIHKNIRSGETQKARRLLKQILQVAGPNISITDYQIEKWKVEQEAKDIPSYYDALPNSGPYFENGSKMIYYVDILKDDHNMMKHPSRIQRFRYPLNRVWHIFNHTGQLAHEKGADLNDLHSVITAIDDSDEPHEVRKNLHLSFSKDIRRAKEMLVRCEAWQRLISK